MDHKVERVKAKAHEIWEREGRPEGRSEEHWRQAEAEVSADAVTGAEGKALREAEMVGRSRSRGEDPNVKR